MQKLCLGLFMLFAVLAYGQEVADVSPPPLQKSTFTLYPNPAFGDVVYITTEKNNPKNIIVYDVFGEVVLTDRIRSNTLSISKLVSGVYVLQVTEGKNTMTRKLVVK